MAFVYRSTIWFIKGLREYTKGGFEHVSRTFNEADLQVDCTGKVYMITGANSGLGKATAFAIAKKGGTVHMVCRDGDRGQQARESVEQETGNKNVTLHQLDLSSPGNIREFSLKFIESVGRLDVLVNNAGCMVNQRQVTPDGLETNFATNVLGPYMLTNALLPLLRRSSDARVIFVSSAGMLIQKLNCDDLQSEMINTFDGAMVYAQNKRQQIVLTDEFAKRYPEVKFFSCHPGWADTPAVQASMPRFYNMMKNYLRTAEQGADTTVWLAVSPAAAAFENGSFFQGILPLAVSDRAPVRKHLLGAGTMESEKEREALWQAVEKICAKF